MISGFHSVLAKVRALFSQKALDLELNEELDSHAQLLTEENLRRGMDYEAARRDALVQIGSFDLARELHRDARGIHWLECLLKDAQLAIRLALKTPWVSAIAIASLAIGIGANVTAFSIAKAILWQPLAAFEPDRLMTIYTRAENGAFGETSYPEYEYFRDHNSVLDGLATYVRIYFFERADGQSQQIAGEIVSANFFSVVRIRPILGRTFAAATDDRQSVTVPEVVISYALWQSQFGGDPHVIGKTLRLGSAFANNAERGDQPFTIVGVADANFRGILMDWVQPPQFWVPLNAYPGAALNPQLFQAWNWHSLPTIGRLKQGVTLEQATAELRALDQRMTRDNPERAQAFGGKYDFSIDVLPIWKARFWPSYRSEIVGYVELVMVVVAIVLGVACLNLANLMTARSAARRRELAVRAALGASRGRLINQMLVESLLLSCIGGATGLLIAGWAWKVVAAMDSANGHFARPFRVVLPQEFRLDPQVTFFALGLTVLTAVLFGVWPAWRASKIDVNDTLKEGGQKGAIAGLQTRSALIAFQIASSVVLMIVASLFVQTVRHADAAGRLMDRSHIGLMSVNVPKEQRARFIERLRTVPGVERACLAAGPTRTDVTFTPAGNRAPVQARVAGAAVCSDYFRMMGVPLVQGRDFGLDESQNSPQVVISEKLARQIVPSGGAIGRQIVLKSSWLFGAKDPAIGLSFVVIGIVKDASLGNYREGIQPTVYFPSLSFSPVDVTLTVQTRPSPYAMFSLLHAAVQEFDPEAPLVNARTLQDDVNAGLSRERLSATVAGVLAIVAFSLTLIGLYGVVSFSVMSRIREIGIRVALGARTEDVLVLLTGQNMRMVLIGLSAGIAIAAVATQVIKSMLYGVQPFDLVTFVEVGGTVTVFALAATLVPAWRAVRRSPLRTLRYE
jgi:predicted permease